MRLVSSNACGGMPEAASIGQGPAPRRTGRGLIRLVCLAVLTVLLTVPLTPLSVGSLAAQEESPGTAGADEKSLREIQQSISARYQRFAKTLTQLHGYMKDSDPARAELLMRVIGKSNEARVDAQMMVILELLDADAPQFGDVVERQEDVIQSLLGLLDVLQSEDERKRLADEIARIEALIGDLNQLVVEQKEVRAGTERGQPTEGLGDRQQKVTDKTQNLADKIEQQDADRQKAEKEAQDEANGENGEKGEKGEKGEGKKGEKGEKGEPSESDPKEKSDTPADEKKPEGEPNSDSEGKDSAPGESSPQEGEPQESKPGEQKPQPGQPQPAGPKPEGGEPQEQSEQSPASENSPEPTPGREEVESAIEKMQRAIDELKEKNRDKASREQDRAIAELEKAKAKLEEILRQLREEEQKIILAALEARFRKMLTMQVNVRKSTGQIADVPEAERLPRHRARAIQLARDEREIVMEADKALILLREEGTSVAFPEAVMQLREDMQTVSERLNAFSVDGLTIAIEDDIIEALDEMIEALRKELEKMEEKEQQQQQQQQQQEGDQGLVDLIAELKLLRSLQYRVNRRTQQIGRGVDGEQAADTELLDLLNQLSERQSRIQRATYDLSVGRNK